MAADLSELDLVAFLVDGVHFGEHCCVVALGIDIDGVKHPLALEEGSTENATLATGLITGLRERGLDVTKPVLAVIDGSKALSRAIRDVFDKPLIQRCQQHKIRNVRDNSPRSCAPSRRSGCARPTTQPPPYRPRACCRRWPASSAGPTPAPLPSLREGLAETLTIIRLDVPPTLARTLHSTNPIESMIGICRDHSSQRQAVAERADGAALVRRRDARSRSSVPPRQWPPAPAETPRGT